MQLDKIYSLIVPCDQNPGCSKWLGAHDTNGYGVVKFRGKQRSVHRVIWELLHGEIPQGLVVRHTCDNKGCCADAHLILGTNRDNMQDAFVRGRKKGSFETFVKCLALYEQNNSPAMIAEKLDLAVSTVKIYLARGKQCTR